MKVSVALHKLQQMSPTGVLLVKDKDGRWIRVEDVAFSAVDTIYAPTTMLLDGVRYIREDEAQRLHGVA